MAPLPEVPRRFAVTPQVESAISRSDIETPFRMLSAALGAAGSLLHDKAEADAQIAGANAVTRDDDGALHVEPRSNLTSGGRAYNRAALTSYVSQFSIDNRSAGTRLVGEARGDPAVFDKAWKEHRRTATRNAPAEARGAIQLTIDQEGERLLSGLITSKRARDNRVALETMKTELGLLDDESAALAAQGGVNTPDYREKQAQIHDILQELSANPEFEYSPDQAAIDLKRIEGRHLAESVVGTVHQVYRRTGSMAEAQKAADLVLNDPSIPLSPSERRQYGAIALSDLKLIDAERRQELKEFRPELSEITQRLNDGHNIDDADVDDAISFLTQHGDGAGALRLAHVQKRARWLSGFKGQSDADQLAMAGFLFDDRSGSFSDRLIGVESGGDPDAANPNSTATGLGQFIESTWTRFIEARHPELLGEGDDVQKFRTDRKLSREAIDWLADENSAALNAAGLPVDDGSLYLAHFAGAVGAIRLLTADESATAEGVLGSEVVAANPFLKGMSAADVVNWASQKMGAPPVTVDRTLIEAAQKEFSEDAKRRWAGIEAGFKAGMPPPADELAIFAKEMSFSDDADFRDHVASTMEGLSDGFVLGNLNPAERESFLATIRAGMGEDGYSEVERDWLTAAEAMNQATKEALKADAYGYAIEREIVPLPEPVDFADPQAAAANLQQRQKSVGLVEQRFGLPPQPAFRPEELNALAAQWLKADPTQRVGALSMLAGSLNEETLRATLAPLAGKSDTAALAYAGVLYKSNPEAAEGVVRGQTLLEQNPKLGPTDDSVFRSKVDAPDGAFPIRALAPMMERSRGHMMQAVLARYADLSNFAGDTTGDFDEARFERAAAEVTGGLVEMNGEKVIAPSYGMGQDAFDARIRALSDDDIRGAVTAGGTPLTADNVRDEAVLRSFGDGRYIVQFGPDEAPTFAQSFSSAPGPRGGRGLFVLDLRQ